jgi:hypothetical protein
LIIAGVIAAVGAVDGCTETPSVARDDVSDVLAIAALAAAKKLPPTYCLSAKLAPSSANWPGEEASDGWIKSTINPDVQFRRIRNSSLGKMPDTALGTFPQPGAGRDCPHTLVFEEPQFVEVKTSREIYLQTEIYLNDPCPTCGALYSVELIKKAGESWTIGPDGLKTIAVS